MKRTIIVHTNEPCIIASHALLLCNVVRKCARFASAASAAVPALVTEESPTAGSDGYACGAWSKVSVGVAGLGDGVGDGDKDSEGVEPVECYTDDIKGNVLVIDDSKKSGAPAGCAMAKGTGASAR